MSETDIQIIDAVMERPLTFKVNGKILYFYPLTLGKTFILQRMTEKMGIKTDSLQHNTSIELLRVAKEQKDACCEMMAYMTARNDYYSVFDMSALLKRKEMFLSVGDDELASLMVIVLTAEKTAAFVKYLGIDKEQEGMRKVMNVKNSMDKNSYTFGGVSVYGSLIDAAMERYGLTKRQVVWEIDYTSLRLLLADRVNTLYVSDEERKKINLPKDRTRVDGDNRDAIIKAIRSQNWN